MTTPSNGVSCLRRRRAPDRQRRWACVDVAIPSFLLLLLLSVPPFVSSHRDDLSRRSLWSAPRRSPSGAAFCFRRAQSHRRAVAVAGAIRPGRADDYDDDVDDGGFRRGGGGSINGRASSPSLTTMSVASRRHIRQLPWPSRMTSRATTTTMMMMKKSERSSSTSSSSPTGKRGVQPSRSARAGTNAEGKSNDRRPIPSGSNKNNKKSDRDGLPPSGDPPKTLLSASSWFPSVMRRSQPPQTVRPGTFLILPLVAIVGIDLLLNIVAITKRSLEFFVLGQAPSTDPWF
jgi:hypothetical protein